MHEHTPRQSCAWIIYTSLKEAFSHPAMHYLLPFTFVMRWLISSWRSPQENHQPWQRFTLLWVNFCFTCVQYSVSKRGAGDKISYNPLDDCSHFFFHYCAFVNLSSTSQQSEELCWTLLRWECNYFVLPVSLARVASSLLRLTLEIEMSAVPGWELLPAEWLTLLHRSCGRVSIVPRKRVDVKKCVD